jgi:aminomethyltransferase
MLRIRTVMPIGTAFHERTFPLCQSLNYREWSGYYAVSAYEVHHEHEYNAIRNASALIDITPLYNYLISGRDATKLVNRIITRDIRKVAPGQVIYCCWCDEQGKVIDDGTITRLDENRYRWTAAEPNLRWFTQNAIGFEVEIRDISRETAALALLKRGAKAKAALPALKKALKDSEASVRAAASRAVLEIDEAVTHEELLRRLRDTKLPAEQRQKA